MPTRHRGRAGGTHAFPRALTPDPATNERTTRHSTGSSGHRGAPQSVGLLVFVIVVIVFFVEVVSVDLPPNLASWERVLYWHRRCWTRAHPPARRSRRPARS